MEDSASYIAENDDHSSTPDVMIVIIIFNDKWWSGLVPLTNTHAHIFLLFFVFCLNKLVETLEKFHTHVHARTFLYFLLYGPLSLFLDKVLYSHPEDNFCIEGRSNRKIARVGTYNFSVRQVFQKAPDKNRHPEVNFQWKIDFFCLVNWK